MKKIKNLLLILIGVSMLASCSVAGPIAVTNNTIGSKRGVAERKIILGMRFGHTDLGVATAAKNGKITKVATVDYKVTGGLFVKKYQTIVTGE